MDRRSHYPGRDTPQRPKSKTNSLLQPIISNDYVKAAFAAFLDITGLDYWAAFPTAYNFDIVKHIKRTCQLTGFLAMTAFASYSFSNWFHWRSYGISSPWNFFGSHFHTLTLFSIAMLSSAYFTYGLGSRGLLEFEIYRSTIGEKFRDLRGI
jgi:hypothetical protein